VPIAAVAVTDAVAVLAVGDVAVSVAVPPAEGTEIGGSVNDPVAPVCPVYVVLPSANLYPAGNVTVTSAPGTDTPFVVAVTDVLIVPHPAPEYDGCANANTTVDDAANAGAATDAAITGTDHAAPLTIVRRRTPTPPVLPPSLGALASWDAGPSFSIVLLTKSPQSLTSPRAQATGIVQ
jgi:hypothetical protein